MFPFKIFSQKSFFCGSLGINLSTGKTAGRGKVAYSWISPDPAEAGPTLGGVVVASQLALGGVPKYTNQILNPRALVIGHGI